MNGQTSVILLGLAAALFLLVGVGVSAYKRIEQYSKRSGSRARGRPMGFADILQALEEDLEARAEREPDGGANQTDTGKTDTEK